VPPIAVRQSAAMKRHSPAPLLGRSDVGSTQQAAIQFATMNVASLAEAVSRLCGHWGQLDRSLSRHLDT
jgi:hypothetical protein